VVKAVLFTHLHYDHVIDATAMRAAHPEAKFYAHSQPDADLTLETVLKESIGWPFDLGDFTMDETLADRLESGLGSVEIAGETIGLLHVPGHSPDSVAFYRMASGELFAGDALFNGSIGRTDFPHGDSDTLLSSIRERIYSLPEETVVYPGHGPSTTVGAEKAGNPYVRP
jgi:glyoxylase-like metal-dependent hydrolase (beta-lactamase superfamily II)